MNSMPRITADRSGRIWLAYRHRQDPRNSGVGGAWVSQVTSLSGAQWAVPAVARSERRNARQSPRSRCPERWAASRLLRRRWPPFTRRRYRRSRAPRRRLDPPRGEPGKGPRARSVGRSPRPDRHRTSLAPDRSGRHRPDAQPSHRRRRQDLSAPAGRIFIATPRFLATAATMAPSKICGVTRSTAPTSTGSATATMTTAAARSTPGG